MITTKRIAAATLVGGIAAGGLFLATGTASAMPSDQSCGVDDVSISIAPDSSHAAGKEGYVITYTATSDNVNCKLQGTPTGVSFVSGGQHTGADVAVAPDAPGSAGDPVNLRAGHPAQSYVLQDSAAPVTFTPDAMNLNLPTGNGFSTTVPWPAGSPLKGTTIHVTNVAAADSTAPATAPTQTTESSSGGSAVGANPLVVAGILGLIG